MSSPAVISESALAKLTVASPILERDALLCLISSLAPPLQLSVSVKKKGNDLTLELNGGTTLTCRNAILRSLCGMGLHNAMDAAPHYLLGGNAGPSAAASPSAALAMAGISSWMSVADSVRTDKEASSEEGLGRLLDHLDSYLTTRSYLVSSPSCTLADLDLYIAIASAAGSKLPDLLGGANRANVGRWLVQCQVTVQDLAASASGASKLPPVKLDGLGSIAPAPQPVPFFFYGDEGDDAIAAASSAASSAAPAAAGGAKQKASGGGDAKKGGAPDGKKGGGGGGDLTEEQKKAAAEKRAKAKADKAAKKAKQPKAEQKGGAAADGELDISALEIRVGKILKAWNHEEAEKLYCEEVDVGEESGPRKIASGLRPFYTLEEMQNRTVLVLCNLKARNLVGFPSHGMVLCASNADHTKVEFAVPPEGAKIGERVTFEGHEGEPVAENKVAKKKIFEKLAPDLKTDESGVVMWKGAKSCTSAGPCRAVNSMPGAQVS